MRNSVIRFGLSVIVVSVVLALPASTARAGDSWQWSLTPYIWATDISEDLRVAGAIVGGEDTEFKDLVDKIDTSLQLHFEGTRGRWGMFADVSYIDLSDSASGEYGFTRLDVAIEETLVEGGAIWRPDGDGSRFELLFGARFLAANEDYSLRIGDLNPITTGLDESYLDALVAARYHIPLSERWVISLRGDVSTGGTDVIWTTQGMVGWRFGSRLGSAVLGGYRYRALEYTKGDDIGVEKTISGPFVAVRIGF